MPLFRKKPVVQAAKIVDVKDPDEHRGARLVFEDFSEATVTPEWLMRQHATTGGLGTIVGGYYVVYDGMYTSWSPAEAFEKEYTEIKPLEPITNLAELNVKVDVGPQEPADPLKTLHYYAFQYRNAASGDAAQKAFEELEEFVDNLN